VSKRFSGETTFAIPRVLDLRLLPSRHAGSMSGVRDAFQDAFAFDKPRAGGFDKLPSIAADPKVVEDLSDEVRLTAACAIVRAANAMQPTTHPAADGARAELVNDALALLNADLAGSSRILDTKQEPGRVDLAAIRDPELLHRHSPEQPVSVGGGEQAVA
jgi:hypothetical protein